MNYQEAWHLLAPDGAAWCRGITPTGHYCPKQHALEGSIDKDGIHWKDRSWERPNILAFLRLIARIREPDIDLDVPWRRVYRLNMAVRALAHELGIVNPARPAYTDRAFVLAGVVGVPNSEPLRKKAFEWARHGPKRKEEA